MIVQPNKSNTGSAIAQDNKDDRDGSLTTSASVEKWARSSDGSLTTSASVDKWTRSRTKRQLNIATYNVRTLNDTNKPNVKHKIQQLINGCERHQIDILTIQEHRLKTETPIKIEKYDDWTLVHTNSTHDSHGVAILYNKQIKQQVIAPERVSDRILALHLDGNPKMCIISAYAPTEVTPSSNKDQFYSDLIRFNLSLPPHTVTITTGDFNARLGKDYSETSPRVVGKHCIHDITNDNGQRLVDLCEATKSRPVHSHFANRRSRLETYIDPRGNKFQLDHIMINTKWWNSIANCRAYNSMDINSDHKVLVANFKLSLRVASKKPNERCKFNTYKLEDQHTRATFNLDLGNRFHALYIPSIDDTATIQIQKRYNALNQAVKETSETVLGKQKKNKHPSWVSQETLELLEKQDNAKSKFKKSQLLEDKNKWRCLQKEVSNAYDRDKRADLNKKLEELEEANQKREHQRTWKIINKISGKSLATTVEVRRLDGSIPSSKDEVLEDWSAYFENLLNNQSRDALEATKPQPTPDLASIPTERITRHEVQTAIQQMKKNKSPGLDYSITAEILKDGGEFIGDQLHTIIDLVYEYKHAPIQWTTSLIVPLPKKGNLQLMSNYRGISLMSIAAKVYNRVLLNRIQAPIDRTLRKNQAGFRPGRSCIQQIHILRRVMDGAQVQDIPLYLTFIDFKKAFDSINREMMFAILRHYGIPSKIVDAIRVLYDQSTSRVFVNGETSKEFKITTGVLQGDVLAPFLFIIVIDYLSKQAEGEFGYITHIANKQPQATTTISLRSKTKENKGREQQENRKLCDLEFADDIALLENEMARSQQQLDAFSSNAAKIGLQINASKTVQMILNPSKDDENTASIVHNGENIEKVEDFKYLGSYVRSTEKDLDARIALTWAAFDKMRSILTSEKLDKNFKIRLFNASCISILLYGCESWNLTKQLNEKVDVFVRKLYRIMFGIRQSEVHMTNRDLYKLAGQQEISEEIRRRQLKFIGHVLRMPSDEPVNIYSLYKSEVKTSNRKGRPRASYLDQISNHLSRDNKIKFDAREIKELAMDKNGWNDRVVAPKKPGR